MKLVNVFVVLDASGSMQSTINDTIGGLNGYAFSLLEDRSTECNLSVLTFNTSYQVTRPLLPVDSIGLLTRSNYRPSGGTALYDALGFLLDAVALVDTSRSQNVLLVVTDGEENSSTRETRASVLERIKRLEARGNWSVVYLGANQDAWAEGSKIGSTTSWTYQADSAGTQKMWQGVSVGTSTLRGTYAKAQGFVDGQTVAMSYAAGFDPAQAVPPVDQTAVPLVPPANPTTANAPTTAEGTE